MSAPVEKYEDGISSSLEDFFKEISNGHAELKVIELKTDELNSQKRRIKNAILSDERDAVSKDINKILDEAYSRQNNVKRIIDRLKDKLDNGKDENPKVEPMNNEDSHLEKKTEPNETSEDSNEKRIKFNLFKSLVKRFQTACYNFQANEEAVKSMLENIIFSSAKNAKGGELSEEEKRNILENPQYVQKFYEDKLKGKAHVKLQNALADIEERHKDIVKLARSLDELHSLVGQMNQLVNYQGEMIDNICLNIKGAKDYSLKAEKNIVEAKKNLQKAHSKKCCVLVIVSVVLAAAVIIPICVTKL